VPSLAVKSFRIWLLVVLAVLLPLRGVMAAAMACPNAHTHEQVRQQVHEHHAMGGMHGAHPEAASHPHGPNGGAHAAAGKCTLCSTCCSAAPMLASFAPTVVEPAGATTVFPRLRATAPVFWSDGPERPPRSI
jgi:hypothetical protein